LQQRFEQGSGLGIREVPSDHAAAVDVEDDVEIEVAPLGRKNGCAIPGSFCTGCAEYQRIECAIRRAIQADRAGRGSFFPLSLGDMAQALAGAGAGRGWGVGFQRQDAKTPRTPSEDADLFAFLASSRLGALALNSSRPLAITKRRRL